jgi:WD40 repeat protein
VKNFHFLSRRGKAFLFVCVLALLGGYFWWKSQPINRALGPSLFVQLVGSGQKLAFLPDGKTLIVSGAGKIQLLDADMGLVTRQWQTETDGLLRLSKDGQRVLASHYDTAKNQFTLVLHDVESGRVLWRKSWQGHAYVEGNTPNLTKLFISRDRRQFLVETATGNVRMVPVKVRGLSAHFSADEKYIFLPGFREASQILLSDTLRPAFPQLKLPPLETLRLIGNNQAAVGLDEKGTLHFWDLKTNSHREVNTGLDDSHWFYLLDDGSFVIKGTRKEEKNYHSPVTQFRSSDGTKLLREVQGDAAFWSHNGKWLIFRLSGGRGTYSRDEEIYEVVEAQTGKTTASINNLLDPLGQPARSFSFLGKNLVISADGRHLASINQGGLLRLFDLNARPAKAGLVSTSKGRTVLSFRESIFSVAIAPDGTIAASGKDNSHKGDRFVRVIKPDGTTQSYRSVVANGDVSVIAFSPDSQKIMGSSQWGVWLADLALGKTNYTGSISGGGWPQQDVGRPIWQSKPNDNCIAVLSGGSYYSGAPTLTEWLHNYNLDCVGKRVVVPPEEKRDGLSYSFGAAKFSPDGSQIVVMWQLTERPAKPKTKSPVVLPVAANGFAEIRDVATGKILSKLDIRLTSNGSALGGGALRTPVWSPDGALIAAPDQGGHVFIWKARSGQLFGQLSGTRLDYSDGMRGGVFVDTLFNQGATLAFSPDNRFLAAARNDGSLYLYDLKTLLPTAQIGLSIASTSGFGPQWIEFSPDGRTLYGVPVSGKEVRAWDVPQIP